MTCQDCGGAACICGDARRMSELMAEGVRLRNALRDAEADNAALQKELDELKTKWFHERYGNSGPDPSFGNPRTP